MYIYFLRTMISFIILQLIFETDLKFKLCLHRHNFGNYLHVINFDYIHLTFTIIHTHTHTFLYSVYIILYLL